MATVCNYNREDDNYDPLNVSALYAILFIR